jgi:hypothetical protein
MSWPQPLPGILTLSNALRTGTGKPFLPFEFCILAPGPLI